MQHEEIRLTQFSKGGGCGCKIAPSVLRQILQTGQKTSFPSLLVGNESSDDAAVYKVDGEMAVISTTDFFLPVVDDPNDFGKIAAANSISDVYAMGGTPIMAVAILGWPVDKLPVTAAQSVLEGARSVCAEANIPLAGGHTIDSNDPIFGLAVTGMVPVKDLKKNNTAQEGDLLFLTKPLGIGILATALKKGLLQPEHYGVLIGQMTKLNSLGNRLGKINGVHAMTDVTGFGLLGHLVEMTSGSGLGAELNYSSINKLAGVDEYLKLKAIPDATFRNWNSYSPHVQFEKGINVMEAFNLLPDPQTNGGLLIAVSPSAEKEIVEILQEAGMNHQPIGRMVKKGEKTILVKN